MAEAREPSPSAEKASPPLLEVRDLVTAFHTDEGTIRAVDGISFDVPAGGTIALVGESGCGKSVTALSILRLVQSPPGRIESGRILLRGKDLLHLSEREMRKLRGSEISMIFQEPMTSLNPVYTVGAQIVEAIRLHQKVSSSEARKRAIEMLAKVGIPSPQERIDAYPHQLSGGMRQRVMIAMALSCEPKLLIADEPTTALDVTIQAQILDLLAKIRAERGLSVVLITHDLGIVAEFADEVVVMYAGKVAERAKVQDLFAEPLHPYTRGLLRSVPSYGENAQRDRLPTIEGVVPDLRSLPRGCRFQDRCPDVAEVCRQKEPPLVKLTLGRGPRAESSREVACFVSVSAVERASDRGPAEVVS